MVPMQLISFLPYEVAAEEKNFKAASASARLSKSPCRVFTLWALELVRQMQRSLCHLEMNI